MGIAWFDADQVSEDSPALRTGGLPLLEAGQRWPSCPRCDMPMLFRAQVPLALTSLVPSSDTRLLLVFECHAYLEGRACDEGTVLVSDAATGEPCAPPAQVSFDLVLEGLGSNPDAVLRMAGSLMDPPERLSPDVALPLTILQAVSRTLGEQAATMLREDGAQAALVPAPPMTLAEPRSGNLIAFDDGYPDVRRTTLPPLGHLRAEAGGAPMRGLIGGTTPGYRDYGVTCAQCGRPTRTAVRLLADTSGTLGDVQLGPSVAELCLRCNLATLHRSS